jgi:hypothetical protein
MAKQILVLILLSLSLGLWAQTGFDLAQFSDSLKYGWQDWQDRRDYRLELDERQKLLQLYEMEANSMRSNILKSAVAPGWGQFANQQNTKGSIFLASELFVLGTSLYFYDRSMFYYRKYQDATQVEDIETYYNAAVSPRQYSLIFLAAGLLIWGYNMFDVIQGTDDYNATVWQNIMERYATSPVKLNADGLRVDF